jgi:quercetin dioxygenase-like cupin family protein
MPGKVRRIVTANRDDGRSYIESDTLLPQAIVAPEEPVRVGLWLTDRAPASTTTPDPVPDGVILRTPPAHRGGSVIRVVDFQPDRLRGHLSAADLVQRGATVTPERSARHPGFHQTDTVDYAVCLEGEIWAMLDEGETLMRPGDVLIQRGTFHAWSNRSDRVCRMLFILIDAEPAFAH